MRKPFLQSLDLTARAGAGALARPERLWVGVALLALVRVAEAGTSDAARLPAGVESFIDGEPLSLHSSEQRAPLASQARAPAELARSADSGKAPASGAATGAAIGRSPWRANTALDAPVGLHQFRLQDFELGDGDLAPSDFRARAHSPTGPAAPLKPEDSLMSDTTTWQRLANDYRGQHRLRVLTLWDAGWSSISLQAGRHGDPSLQWTGHLFGHGETHHGVLDNWVSSVSGFSGFSGGISSARGEAHGFGALSRTPAATLSHPAAVP